MAKPEDDNGALNALFTRPPTDAIDYLRRKGLRITFRWQEMLDEAHARAFTVAKAMQLDVLRDIRGALLDALKEGTPLREFNKALVPKLQAKGWWGKQVVVDSRGAAEEVQLGSLRRLKTIYQTNLQSAYMEGRAKMVAETSDAFPYVMYVAVMDTRTRPAHAALNGKVWRKDDPAWEVIRPPNGYNCRCSMVALTEGMLKRRGLTVSPPPEILSRTINTGTDAVTGELFPAVQKGIRFEDAAGRTREMWVDAGFNSGAQTGHVFDEVLARKAVAALGDKAGFAHVRALLHSAPRSKAWTAFIDGAFEPGFRVKDGNLPIQKQSMTVGILPLEIARELIARGKPTMPVLHVEDRIVIGRKARRHSEAGNALSREQWEALPQLLKGATYYLDKDSGNVLAVADTDPGMALKVAFSPTGAADTAFIVPAESVEGAISGGRWELLNGRRGT